MKFFYGILFFVVGAAIIKYRKTVYEWTGRFVWAERYLGNGGTVFVIVLVGCVLIFLSVAYPMGAVKPGTGGLAPEYGNRAPEYERGADDPGANAGE
jgi:hypothetical protein